MINYVVVVSLRKVRRLTEYFRGHILILVFSLTQQVSKEN